MRAQPLANAAKLAGTDRSVQSLIDRSTRFASFRLTANGELIGANAAFLRLMGCETALELAERDFREDVLLDPADWAHWQRAAAGETVSGVEISFKGKGSRSISLAGDIGLGPGPGGIDAGLTALFVDVSESSLVQAALQHAARSEAVTSLTSGMVHDFKNLLTVLVGNLYLVAEGVRDKPELFEQAKRARDVARRGADLTRSLLALSRTDETAADTLDLRRVLGTLEPMLEHSIGSRISLECALDPDLAPVAAKAAELESAVVNLVINARDAIKDQGRITISAANTEVGTEQARQLGVLPGDYVRLSIRDDGPGIPQALQAKVFEPFYSTKSKERGTGLGLSMVRWFAEGRGGAVLLESAEGRGTTITLLLPAAEAAPQDSALMTMPLKSLPAGDEAVLVIARERELVDTLADSLSVLGYRVTATHDGQAIFEQLKAQPFRLLILDASAVVSSRLIHFERAIKKRFPDLRVLIVASQADIEAAGGRLDSKCLTKPFTLKDLASSVRASLDGAEDD